MQLVGRPEVPAEPSHRLLGLIACTAPTRHAGESTAAVSAVHAGPCRRCHRSDDGITSGKARRSACEVSRGAS